MKYALTFLFSFITIFITLLYSENSYARTITHFRDSDALTTMAQFMYDAAEDLPQSIKMSDKKMNIKDTKNCVTVSADDVFQDVSRAIKKIIRFYPDEELPFEQALIDLEDYLDHQSFKKCTMEKVTPQSRILISYFLDKHDLIHVRLDTSLN